MKKAVIIAVIIVVLVLPTSAFGVQRGIVGSYDLENGEKITFYAGGRLKGYKDYVLYRQVSENSVYLYKKSGVRDKYDIMITFDRSVIYLCHSF